MWGWAAVLNRAGRQGYFENVKSEQRLEGEGYLGRRSHLERSWNKGPKAENAWYT